MPPTPPEAAQDSLPRNLAQVVQHSFQLLGHRLELVGFDLRDELRQVLLRVAMASVAALFGLGALASLSVALYLGLCVWLRPGAAVLALAACHSAVVVALVLTIRRMAPTRRATGASQADDHLQERTSA